MARATVEGWTDAFLRERIREHVGLDQRGSNAVERYRQGLVDNGIPQGRAARMASQYAGRMRRKRAAVIAQHETAKVVLEAQRTLWAERQGRGEIGRRAVRVWRLGKGEKGCVACKRLNGTRASVNPGRGYNVKGVGLVDGPPLHPNCKCSEDLVDQEIVKHLPGLHDQDKHGRKGSFRLNFRVDRKVQKALDVMERSGSTLYGLGRGIVDMMNAYPNLAETISAIRFDTDFEYEAGVGPSSSGVGVDIVINPKKLSSGFTGLQVNRNAWDTYGMPEEIIARDVRSGNLPSLSVLAQNYGYAVGVHEFGHIAQRYIIEEEHWETEGRMTGTVLRHMQVQARMRDYPPLVGLPSVSKYGYSNDAEKFAEWWAGHHLGLLPPQIEALYGGFLENVVRRYLSSVPNGSRQS